MSVWSQEVKILNYNRFKSQLTQRVTSLSLQAKVASQIHPNLARSQPSHWEDWQFSTQKTNVLSTNDSYRNSTTHATLMHSRNEQDSFSFSIAIKWHFQSLIDSYSDMNAIYIFNNLCPTLRKGSVQLKKYTSCKFQIKNWWVASIDLTFSWDNIKDTGNFVRSLFV